ncbi:MAG: glutamate--tRNA ligase [Gemmatimonadota bacterium]
MSSFRVRFAPSPTGSLHVGNARIAVLNWLLARHHGGTFVLRIEDTDVDRNLEDSESGILTDLAWLDMEPDEGPGADGAVRGSYGPYRQSERLPHYRAQAERLLAEGQAFHCYCTPDELRERREQAMARGDKPHYDGTCLHLTRQQVAAFQQEGRTPTIRFHVPDGEAVEIQDAVRGTVRVEREDIGDFILLRSDGLPTYNFAVVVDDAAMAISHVVRGAGHLSNTPRQALLFDALGFQRPAFAHVPTVLGPDRQKLSKRHGARPLSAYRKEGYHPDAVVNYLSLLSWSSPSGDEVLDRARLVHEISLDRIGTADVVFDPDKLRWLSAKHIDAMPADALITAVRPFIDFQRHPIRDEAVPTIIEAVRSHLSAFSDIDGLLDPFVPGLDADARARRDAGLAGPGARDVVRAARRLFADTEAGDERAPADAIRRAGADAGVRGRDLYIPLRLALTGDEHGPPLAAIVQALGRTAALDMLGDALGED